TAATTYAHGCRAVIVAIATYRVKRSYNSGKTTRSIRTFIGSHIHSFLLNTCGVSNVGNNILKDKTVIAHSYSVTTLLQTVVARGMGRILVGSGRRFHKIRVEEGVVSVSCSKRRLPCACTVFN